MAKLSVIILAKNEEIHIKNCLLSVQFADEMLVLDDFSTDNTVAIAKEYGGKVIQHALNGDWSQQRRFGIEQASGDWILFLDSDERISDGLGEEIQQAIQREPFKSYWIKRHNLFHYNKATHGVLRPDKVLRLMPKAGAQVEGFVHETIFSPYEQDDLIEPMYHYTYDNWHQYFNKFNKYTTVAAEKYKEEGKSCSFVKDIIIRPSWAFIKVYLLQGGILDGKLGFILSVNHYMYTMTKYVKLYYLLKSNGRL